MNGRVGNEDGAGVLKPNVLNVKHPDGISSLRICADGFPLLHPIPKLSTPAGAQRNGSWTGSAGTPQKIVDRYSTGSVRLIPAALMSRPKSPPVRAATTRYCGTDPLSGAWKTKRPACPSETVVRNSGMTM